jgi:hypothetical protein
MTRTPMQQSFKNIVFLNMSLATRGQRVPAIMFSDHLWLHFTGNQLN